MKQYETTTYTNSDDFALVLTDNGQGNLLYQKSIVGTVNYSTGETVIDTTLLLGKITQPQYSAYQITQTASNVNLPSGKRETADVFVSAAYAKIASVQNNSNRPVQTTMETGYQTYNILGDKARPCYAVLNTWVFEINGKRTIEREGVLYQDWDFSKGEGKAIGTLNVAGKLMINSQLNASNPVKVLQGVYVSGEYQVQSYAGRTAVAPIKPQSFSVYVDGNDDLVGKSQADERITGKITGKIHYETGAFIINAPEPITPDALRYNAVSQSTVPLESQIIGINATRLPLDGKVAIFKTGDVVVIHNTQKQDLGSAHRGGQTVSLNRQNLDRLCIVDNTGKHINAAYYDYDLDNGTLTWRTPLNLGEYEMPLSAHLIWEEDNRVVHADVLGKLTLQNPLTRDYPMEDTFVSSALVLGDVLVRATEPFSQKSWTGVWQNTRIGNALLAKLNVKDYPIVLTADGAISERWLLRFTSASQFELFGESLGLVAVGDTVSDLAPINPATGKPYFRLAAAAFGGGWSAQDCIRFNTQGTPSPVWVIRAVSPTGRKHSQEDAFSVCLRGDTVVG